MKILFLCTAHNSLSQRLYVALAEKHTLSIELALSDNVMIEAVNLFQPDLILCPFLTIAVPKEIHKTHLTLIVHPGPPGDAGPSSLDWLLIGDDGTEPDTKSLLATQSWSEKGRSHWGVSIIQATETFDAGPVWSFEQFPIDIDTPGLTKSSLYRGPMTRAALVATSAALSRIEAGANPSLSDINPTLPALPEYAVKSITRQTPFEGGKTIARPLLKATDREFDILKDTAKQISRKIRCGDSQPGCPSSLFGPKLYLYGGAIENKIHTSETTLGKIIHCQDEAVCVLTCDQKSIWITHLRRLKRKENKLLWPKVPAFSYLSGSQLIKDYEGSTRDAVYSGHQEIRIDFETINQKQTAYIYFDFYNGAMSTDQCARLLKAITTTVESHPLSAVVLMGGSDYFSNGIHLNVIEAAADPASETWRNINHINALVFYILHELPRRNILSVAALRGNCAAGGVALAAACDHVIAGVDVVLNPSYRAIGLHGSEYHTLSYRGRCGTTKAASLLRNMLPLSASNAQLIGLIDHVLHDSDKELEISIRQKVATLTASTPTWKMNMDLSLSALQTAQANELAEMAKDCWSPRAERFNSRRTAFVCKIKPAATPLRLAAHRRQFGKTYLLDDEEKDEFDSVEMYQLRAKQAAEDAACRPVLQHLMGNVVNVFGKGLRMEPSVDSVEDKTQLQMIFPCYYQT